MNARLENIKSRLASLSQESPKLFFGIASPVVVHHSKSEFVRYSTIGVPGWPEAVAKAGFGWEIGVPVFFSAFAIDAPAPKSDRSGDPWETQVFAFVDHHVASDEMAIYELDKKVIGPRWEEFRRLCREVIEAANLRQFLPAGSDIGDVAAKAWLALLISELNPFPVQLTDSQSSVNYTYLVPAQDVFSASISVLGLLTDRHGEADKSETLAKEPANLPELGKEELALAVLQTNPGWSDTRIAAQVGVARTSLYRFKKFKAARAVQRSARGQMPRGSKNKDGDVEAWEADE